MNNSDRDQNVLYVVAPAEDDEERCNTRESFSATTDSEVEDFDLSSHPGWNRSPEALRKLAAAVLEGSSAPSDIPVISRRNRSDIAQAASSAAEAINVLSESRINAALEYERQEAARTLAALLGMISHAYRVDEPYGSTRFRRLRKLNAAAEALLICFSLLSRFPRTPGVCKWERVSRWASLGAALFAAGSFAFGYLVVGAVALVTRALGSMALQPPALSIDGTRRRTQVDWAGGVAHHAGEAAMLAGIGVALAHQQRVGWGFVVMLAALFSLAGTVNRLAALQQGVNLPYPALAKLVRHSANCGVVLGYLIFKPSFAADVVPLLACCGLAPIAIAVADMYRTFHHTRRHHPSLWDNDNDEMFNWNAHAVASVLDGAELRHQQTIIERGAHDQVLGDPRRRAM